MNLSWCYSIWGRASHHTTVVIETFLSYCGQSWTGHARCWWPLVNYTFCFFVNFEGEVIWKVIEWFCKRIKHFLLRSGLETIEENDGHFLVSQNTSDKFPTPHSTQLPVFSFFFTLMGCNWQERLQRFCLLMWFESYPRLSLSVSLGKVFGILLRCLKVQWTSLTPGQLQLRGQDATARV